MINSKRDELNSTVSIQQSLMKILMGYIKKMVNSLDTSNLIYSNNILGLLEKSKESLKRCNENMNLLNSSIRDFNNHSENFEINYENNIKKINYNTIFIENHIYSLLQSFELALHLKEKKNEIKKSNNDLKITIHKENEKIPELIKNKENCLIISETSGNIILPYYINDLTNIKNKTYEQTIQENYTLPVDLFKPAFVARFREAFKLARNKEKKSLKFSFDLGLELLFNYNLHPAIIAACRNLDELDIYLDCLDSGETDKFQCFNIKFEVPPVVIKK